MPAVQKWHQLFASRYYGSIVLAACRRSACRGRQGNARPGIGRCRMPLTFVRSDDEFEVELVLRVGEVYAHSRGKVELGNVCIRDQFPRQEQRSREGTNGTSAPVSSGSYGRSILCARSLDQAMRDSPFCTRMSAADVFGFFFAAASSFFFIDHICAFVRRPGRQRQSDKATRPFRISTKRTHLDHDCWSGHALCPTWLVPLLVLLLCGLL